MTKTKNKTHYSFRLLNKDGGLIDRCHTTSLRRFYHRIGTINWQLRGKKVYLRISYGQDIDCWGEKVYFYNDGNYTTKHDFQKAFNAFLEER
jgi:hypothetical protein